MASASVRGGEKETNKRKDGSASPARRSYFRLNLRLCLRRLLKLFLKKTSTPQESGREGARRRSAGSLQQLAREPLDAAGFFLPPGRPTDFVLVI